MDTDIHRLLSDQKIQLLEDQIDNLKEQIQMYKKSYEDLLRATQEINLRQNIFTLEIKNRELQEVLEIERKRNEELQHKKYQEGKRLREQLKQKNHQIQIMKIQHEKQLFRIGEQIRHLKFQLRSSNKDKLNIDQLSKSLAISSCLTEIRNGDQNYLDRSNHLSMIHLQKSRKKSTNSHLSNMQKSKAATFQNSTNNQFFNYSKDQLRVALKTLNKAGKSLRQGSMEASVFQERQSYLKFSKK